MTAESVTVFPSAVDVGDETVSAAVERAAGGRDWDVTVVISRLPDLPRLPASDVTASLTDADGRALPLAGRDTGALVEAGSSLAVSVNANFRFSASGRPPTRLTVAYRGTMAEFRLDAGRHG